MSGQRVNYASLLSIESGDNFICLAWKMIFMICLSIISSLCKVSLANYPAQAYEIKFFPLLFFHNFVKSVVLFHQDLPLEMLLYDKKQNLFVILFFSNLQFSRQYF